MNLSASKEADIETVGKRSQIQHGRPNSCKEETTCLNANTFCIKAGFLKRRLSIGANYVRYLTTSWRVTITLVCSNFIYKSAIC